MSDKLIDFLQNDPSDFQSILSYHDSEDSDDVEEDGPFHSIQDKIAEINNLKLMISNQNLVETFLTEGSNMNPTVLSKTIEKPFEEQKTLNDLEEHLASLECQLECDKNKLQQLMVKYKIQQQEVSKTGSNEDELKASPSLRQINIIRKVLLAIMAVDEPASTDIVRQNIEMAEFLTGNRTLDYYTKEKN